MATTTAATETNFAEQFREFLRNENDGERREARERAFAYFEANGYPAPPAEDWKYTSFKDAAKSDWIAKPAAMDSAITESFSSLLSGFSYRRNGLTALNRAFANASIIHIPKDTVIEGPIELSFGGNEGEMAISHVLVIAEAGSKATIVETYGSPGKSFTNTAIQIMAEDNASLTHYRVQKESPDAFHYGVTEITLGRDSRYDSTNINLGGAVSRHDIELKFTAEGAEAWVDGLYMLNGSQHSDTHSVIDHTVPNCTSHQNYKGVLNDKSRGVFNGKVFVRENAHGTDAQQSNKNLLLSNEARVDTKPQLEIFNDDVKCSHGATVGQLEDEELFYLLTRGLPVPLAKNLLTYGFAEEIINKIGIELIKMDLDEAVLNRLNTRLEA